MPVTNLRNDGMRRPILLGPGPTFESGFSFDMSFFEYVMSLGPKATQEFADSPEAREGWKIGIRADWALHNFEYRVPLAVEIPAEEVLELQAA